MFSEMIDQIKEIYLKAFEHLRKSWPKMLSWTAAWLILYWIFQGQVEANTKYASILIDLGLEHADATSIFVKTAVFGLISFFLGIFMIYSLMGLTMETNDDPDTNWLTCGIQGFLSPLRTIKVSVLFELTRYIVLYVGGAIAIFFGLLLGPFIYIIFIIFYLTYLYFLLRLGLTWFNAINSPEQGALNAISKSFVDMKGRVIYLLMILLPVILLAVGLFLGSASCDKKHNEAFEIEIEMAKFAVEAIHTTLEEDQEYLAKLETSAYNELDVARLKNVMASKIFDDPVPEYEDYEGDIKAYIAALAEYGCKRDSFEANRDDREPAEITQAYLTRPESGSRWLFLGLICDLLIICLATIALSLMIQFYRRIESLPVSTPVPSNKDQDETPEASALLFKEPEPAAPTPETDSTSSKDEIPSFIMPEINIPEITDTQSEASQSSSVTDSHIETAKAQPDIIFPEISIPDIPQNDKPNNNMSVIDIPDVDKLLMDISTPHDNPKSDPAPSLQDEDSLPFQPEVAETTKPHDPFADFFNPKVPKGPANIIKR